MGEDLKGRGVGLLPMLWVVVSLIVVALPYHAVAAQRVVGLGSVRMWVDNSSAQARTNALPQALSEVLVRLSGAVAVLDTALAKSLLKKPSAYLTAYAYESAKPTEQPWPQRLAGRSEGLWLQLRFDDQALATVLREQGLPVWGSTRPVVLCWLGVDLDGQRIVLSDQDRQGLGQGGFDPTSGRRLDFGGGLGQDEAARSVSAAASKRGLPVTLPVLDQEDLSQGVQAAIFGLGVDTVMVASRRYGADAILVGRAQKLRHDEWQGDWRLIVNGEHYLFEGQTAASVAGLAALAVDRVTEQLAKLYSVVSDDEAARRVNVRVVGVHDYDTYRTVQAYLQRLNGVKRVMLQRADGEQLLYRVDLSGGVEPFKKVVALDHRLAPSDAQSASAPDGAPSASFGSSFGSSHEPSPGYTTPSITISDTADTAITSDTGAPSLGVPGAAGAPTHERAPIVLEYRWVGS